MNLNFFKKINFHNSYHKKTLHFFVLRSWETIILTSVIATLVVFAGSFYVYRRVNSGNLITRDASEQLNVKPVDKMKLSEIILYFEQKKIKADNALERKFVDPSL